MKRIFFTLALIFLFLVGQAQTPQKYWIKFANKGGSPYSFSNPSAYLSPRAIARRTTYSISIDSLDLPVTPAYINAVAATGVTVRASSKWLNGIVIITDDTLALQQIAALPFVVQLDSIGLRRSGSGEPNKFEKEKAITTPFRVNPYRTANLTSTMLSYGNSFNQVDMIGGVCLHNAGFRGQGMVIAVLDGGFRNVDMMNAFDSLRAYNRILGTYDFVEGDNSVYEDDTHGTYVLSCMGANLPGDLVGTAPEASYWLLRSEDVASEYIVEEYFWASAAEFADSVGADLINSSLGYTTFDDINQNHTYSDMDGNTTPCSRAADIAASRGILVCNSAGNSGSSSWFYVGAPADADSILAVGAVDPLGNYATFSSRGPSADGQVKPSVAAQGQSTVLAALSGGTFQGNGTSFSSPVLCGMAACLWQAHPQLNNMQIIDQIIQSSSQYNAPDTYLGYGIPDFCAANLALGGNPNNLGEQDDLFMYGPNPFIEELQFSFYSTQGQWLQIQLSDASGRIVMDQQMYAAGNAGNFYRLNVLPGFAKGVYILQIKSENETFTRKLVKAQ